jgi:hypothetical protein
MSAYPNPLVGNPTMPQPYQGGPFDPGTLTLPNNMTGNNGTGDAGAWASGGFNTTGAATGSGFNFFGGASGGSNTGLFGLPNNTFSAYGSPTIPGAVPSSGPATSPGANNNYGFNPTTGLPTIGNPGIGVTSATQGPFPQIDTNALKKLYGNGVGGALSQFLNSGAGFNSQVIQAQINEAMPIEAQTVGKMMNLFGASGNAYSSTAALGVGNFESQFNAALSGEFAQEYQQSVQNYMDILMKVAPGAQAQNAQSMSFISTLESVAKLGLDAAALGLHG